MGSDEYSRKEANQALSILNMEKRKILTSKEYRLGVTMARAIDTVKRMDIKKLVITGNVILYPKGSECTTNIMKIF